MRKGRMDEEVEVRRGADHRDPAGAGGGGGGDGAVSQARDQLAYFLQVEGQVRRPGRVRGASTEGAGGRERQAQAAAGRGHAGQRGAEGPAWKKMVTPAARREAAAYLRTAHGMSERRACRVLTVDRASVRYEA